MKEEKVYNTCPRKKEPIHTSKNGSILFDKRYNYWTARIAIGNIAKGYSSPYRQDCERWLSNIKANGDNTNDTEWVRQEIISRGGTNPQQVPDFPLHFLTDEGDLWSCKQQRLRILKRSRGIYYRLSRNDGEVSCTEEKLRYCINNKVSPLTLSQCKLSVEQGTSELMDYTEYAQKRLAEGRIKNISEHAEEYIEITEKWCHNVLLFWRGNKEAGVELGRISDSLRPFLTGYVRNVLRQVDECKVQFIVDEVIGETLLRALDRKSIIFSPYTYMQRLARKFHDIIKDCGGRVQQLEGSVRVIGGFKKGDIKKIYNL